MALTKRLRYEILRRDNHTCRYCGESAPDVKLTVDHVLPVALGGKDDATNLVAACRDCNAGKSSSHPDQPLIDQVSDDAIRWAQAVVHASQEIEKYIGDRTKYINAVRKHWNSYGYGPSDNRHKVLVPSGWRDSVRTFMRRGLPLSAFREAIDITMDRDMVALPGKWRYCMGIAWKMLDDIEETAKTIYTTEGRV